MRQQAKETLVTAGDAVLPGGELEGHRVEGGPQLGTASDLIAVPGGITPESYGCLLRFAGSLLRNPDDARDAVQTSLRKALEHLHSFDGRAKIQTWVTSILINECLLHLRHASHWRLMQFEDIGGSIRCDRDNPEEVAARKELRQLLTREVNSMPKVYKDALILHDLEQRALDEVGRELGASLGAVKSRVFRGRRELRKRLERHGVDAQMLHPG